MRVLITGITGFVGSHLAEYLLSINESEKVIIDLFGTAKQCDPLENISGIKDKITFIKDWDIRHAGSCDRAIEVSMPDYIFHLVSQKPWPAAKYPLAELEINTLGTARMFEAVNRLGLHPVIILAGCGEEYGCPPLVELRHNEYGFMEKDTKPAWRINHTPAKVLKLPVTEDFSLNPMSIYGVSKAAQDMLGFAYYKEYGMKIIRTRAFDISGPRDESSVASYIARQMVEIERGYCKSILKVGSLDIKKDFTDVRDVVKAYWLAATRCKFGEAYNICSGKARSVQTVIDTLRLQSGAQFDIAQDKTLMKASDVPVLEGDRGKFTRQTGWEPKIGFAKTMGDLLDYWRGRI